MKKNLKIFSVGSYGSRGDYSAERVKQLFGDVANNPAGIFMHTSNWKDLEKDPPKLSEFSNFEIKGSDVYADCEFNEKGENYFNDGIIKSVSVEITKNGIPRIALLPPGVNPAVQGAEFSEQDTYFTELVVIGETEEEANVNKIDKVEEKVMTLEEILEFMKSSTIGDKITIMSAIVGSLSEADTRAARALAWEFAEKTDVTADDLAEFAEKKGLIADVKIKPKAKTESEIREELTKEFAAEKELEKEVSEFSEMLDKKVLPAHKTAYLEAFKSSLEKNKVIEFSETEKTTMKEHLKKQVAAMNDVEGLTKEFAAGSEGENVGVPEWQQEINAAKNEVKKINGGV